MECTTESTENTRTILWEGVIPTPAGPLSTSMRGVRCRRAAQGAFQSSASPPPN